MKFLCPSISSTLLRATRNASNQNTKENKIKSNKKSNKNNNRRINHKIRVILAMLNLCTNKSN